MNLKTTRKRMSPAASAAGLSALYCCKCGNHFSITEQERLLNNYGVDCSKCDHREDEMEAGVTIHPDYFDFLKKDNLRANDRVWYHATTRENWYDSLESYAFTTERDPLVHIGSKATALDRARQMAKIWRGEGWLHTVKILPYAEISNFVVEDMNYWPERAHEIGRGDFKKFTSVTRYLNRYEEPGSISLLVDYRVIRVVDTVRLPA